MLRCIECGSIYEDPAYRCSCSGLLEVVLQPREVSWSRIERREKSLWRYRELIPVDYRRRVSMQEGYTPLIECSKLARKLGLKRLYLKYEGANPTGSFKDRGMTVAVTRAVELRFRRLMAASTGNTAASLAAYAARAGLECKLVLPRGGVAGGKLAQALLHGAQVEEVDGSFDHALELVLSSRGWYILNSVNPWRIEGQKTAYLEVLEQLGKPPDHIVLPMGNCGNIASYWKAAREAVEAGLARELPRLIGVQAEGAAPVAEMILKGLSRPRFTSTPRTMASAIRIGKPVNWPKAARAIRESLGTAEVVSDSEIAEAQLKLARLEGIGVEPASAAPLAALPKLIERGVIDPCETIVVVATGTALKDPEHVMKVASSTQLQQAHDASTRRL